MGKTYAQLSLEDRCQIARLHAEGRSIRQIAADLDRAPSTVAREVKRNSGRKVGYKPAYANEQAAARRWKGSKLVRKPELRDAVLAGLAQGWSPEQVAGRLALDNAAPRVSYETIYRFIYAQIARTKDYSWRLYLPRAKSKRGWRGRKGGSPASFIQDRVGVHNRDPEARDRSVSGHWDRSRHVRKIRSGDPNSARALIAHPARRATRQQDRRSHRPPSRALPRSPPRGDAPITFDNGTEFARHHRLHCLGLQTYFCDPHAPWQKGGIENAIGRLRRTLPRKTDLATITDHRFKALIRAYNATPRKCLDFRTPAELFLEQLLHFKCESTSRPAPG